MPDSPTAPFELGDGPDACLLLHGFSGAPSEVRPLGERLARAGMRVIAPLLPGHGTSAALLREVSREDLLAAARAALDGLSGARRVFLGGLSAGAMLAITLAAEARVRQGQRPVTALALLAPAVRFAGTTWLFTQALGRLPLPARTPLYLDKGARDVKGPGTPITTISRELRTDGSLARVPLGWGRELRLLSTEALALAPRVRAPTLILQGGRDTTAAPAGARLLAGRLGAQVLELRLFPESGHVLPIDRDGPAVCDAIADFFARSAAI
jgi:carboxylesterase